MRALTVGLEDDALRRELLNSCHTTDDRPRPSLVGFQRKPETGETNFKSIAKQRRSSFAGRGFFDTAEIIRRLRDSASA